MTDQLEARLREAFALRAAEVPADAVDRLRGTDYRPRVRRRWPVTVGTVGAASGTAAVMSVVMLGGSPPAFAGWSPTPAPQARLQSSTTQGGCQGQLADVPGGSAGGGWTEVASDARGPYTMVVYENGSNLASCFTGPSFTTFQEESFSASTGGAVRSGEMSVSASGGSASTAGAPGPHLSSNSVQFLSGGDLEQAVVSHLSQSANGAYTLVEGRLAPGVSGVTLVLSDGQRVTATTGSGWLVAWWPGDQDVASADITSASGTTTEPLSASSPPQPPPPGTAADHQSSSGQTVRPSLGANASAGTNP